MSDAYNDIVDLVGDAIEAGAYYVNDVVEYVNERSRLKVDRDMVNGIIESLDFDYAGGASRMMYVNKLEAGE
jgi:phage-related protein